jgi:2,4-dienoyl-CoA reductase-like NADH-dependent reductase (Old Yellow Enzyme family)
MILKKIKIGNNYLKNRIVVSPMCQYSANNGCPSIWHYSHLGSLMNSGASMLMIESTSVNMNGRITNKDLCLKNKIQAQKMKKLLIFLKKINTIPIGLQISHSGRKGSSYIPWVKNNKPLEGKDSWQTYSASPIKKDKGWPTPKELNFKKINILINDFINTCKIANKIGIDAIEIHMAHGYLIHQFLSPISNKRKDIYGGNDKNRMRLALIISKKIRKMWPKNKILGARITGEDHLPNGIKIKNAIKLTKELKKIGFDYICVSSGGIISKTNLKNNLEGFRVKIANKIKKNVKIKIRTSGNLSNLHFLNKAFKKKLIDFAAIGRPFLNNPRWLLNYLAKNKNHDFPHQWVRGFN